jgi:hypothetical protein
MRLTVVGVYYLNMETSGVTTKGSSSLKNRY